MQSCLQPREMRYQSLRGTVQTHDLEDFHR
jgi:hypothetical protein